MTRPGAGHVPDKTSGLTLAGAFARSSLALGAVLASVALAHATYAWMSEQDLRAEFIGKAFEGYYYDGSEWWAAFAADGQYSLREKGLSAQGVWYFRGRVFCGLFGPPPWVLDEHCALVTRLSANCYEFHTVWPDESPRGRPRPGPSWHSRGWRLGEPSTCADRPIS